MAKRGVIDHPKFARLKIAIKANKSTTLGYLECLWQFTGRYTPQGDIGKYANEEIEAWLEWDGEEGHLIAALIKCGWIDVSEEHRLLIHDWHDHVDNTTRTALKRSGKDTIGSCNSVETQPESVEAVSQQSHNTVETEIKPVETVLTPPEPVPEPVPEPKKEINKENPPPIELWISDIPFENELIQILRSSKGYQEFIPDRDRFDKWLSSARSDAPNDDAILSLVESFRERAEKFRPSRSKGAREYTDVLLALTKWAERARPDWIRLKAEQQRLKNAEAVAKKFGGGVGLADSENGRRKKDTEIISVDYFDPEYGGNRSICLSVEIGLSESEKQRKGEEFLAEEGLESPRSRLKA